MGELVNTEHIFLSFLCILHIILPFSIHPSCKFPSVDPVYMPDPSIVATSPVTLNISWPEPGVRDVLGFVQEYHLYQLQRADPVLSPFAPPEQWVVSEQ